MTLDFVMTLCLLAAAAGYWWAQRNNAAANASEMYDALISTAGRLEADDRVKSDRLYETAQGLEIAIRAWENKFTLSEEDTEKVRVAIAFSTRESTFRLVGISDQYGRRAKIYKSLMTIGKVRTAKLK